MFLTLICSGRGIDWDPGPFLPFLLNKENRIPQFLILFIKGFVKVFLIPFCNTTSEFKVMRISFKVKQSHQIYSCTKTICSSMDLSIKNVQIKANRYFCKMIIKKNHKVYRISQFCESTASNKEYFKKFSL